MQTFIIKSALLLLIIAGIIFLFMVCPWLDREPFQNIKKKHAILGKTVGKKVILIGGSGVANGLSAGVIEAHLPGYKAVNMGLNAGLGLKFNLSEIMEYIKPCDIVILSPEYDNFEGEYKGGVQVLKAINVAPFTSRYVTRDDYVELLRNEFLTLLQVKAQSYLDGFIGSITGIGAVSIDESGDRTNNSASRDVSNMEFSFKISLEPYEECVAALNRFDQYCKKRGAIAVLSFPSLPSTQFRRSKQEIETLYSNLLKDTSILILHPPATSVFEPALFDDTVYHLGKRGREIRSLKIASLIKDRVLNHEANVTFPFLSCRQGRPLQ